VGHPHSYLAAQGLNRAESPSKKAAEIPIRKNMGVSLKKILASRLLGVLTMLPTRRLQWITHRGKLVNEGNSICR
jgi:hypothetical protein